MSKTGETCRQSVVSTTGTDLDVAHGNAGPVRPIDRRRHLLEDVLGCGLWQAAPLQSKHIGMIMSSEPCLWRWDVKADV